MGEILCSECSKQVSEYAPMCEYCGKTIEKNLKQAVISAADETEESIQVASLNDIELLKIIQNHTPVKSSPMEKKVRREWEKRNLPIKKIEDLKIQIALAEELGASEWNAIKACVVCHSGKINLKREPSCFGLFSRDWIVCEQCSTAFQKNGTMWKWARMGREGKLIWAKYGNRSLSVHEWQRISQGGISDSEQRDSDISSCLEKIKTGVLQIKIIETNPAILLQSSEEVILALPNICLLETRAIRVSKGSYGGPRFQISRRISYGFGSFSSRSESEQKLRKIDDGTLIITSKRFVYSGAIRTVQIDLRKIIQIDPLDDGIGLHKENKEKTQYFTWTYFDDAWFVRGDRNAVRRASSRTKEVEFNENGRRYSVPLTGEILKAVIENAVKMYAK